MIKISRPDRIRVYKGEVKKQTFLSVIKVIIWALIIGTATGFAIDHLARLIAKTFC